MVHPAITALLHLLLVCKFRIVDGKNKHDSDDTTKNLFLKNAAEPSNNKFTFNNKNKYSAVFEPLEERIDPITLLEDRESTYDDDMNNNALQAVSIDLLTTDDFGSTGGVCVIGCTPYVDITQRDDGIRKYQALVNEMASDNCDIIVHVGDTKSGKLPCTPSYMTDTLHMLRRAGQRHNTLVLYTPGDNELNDCHRQQKSTNYPSIISRASDARKYLIKNLGLRRSTDLTGAYKVKNHLSLAHKKIPGTDENYDCAFDKYVEVPGQKYAVATLEVLGSYYYLDDERHDVNPDQDTVDPLSDRLNLYLNANECSLDWIRRTARTASQNNLRAVIFTLHAAFYKSDGSKELDNNGIGQYYNEDELLRYVKDRGIDANITTPYGPLFDELTTTAQAHPDLMFYVVHSDSHRFRTIRMNGGIDNTKDMHTGDYKSHHNVMIHMVEGSSRALTMYTRLTVDSDAFQPVTLKEEWSIDAYNVIPRGHSAVLI